MGSCGLPPAPLPEAASFSGIDGTGVSGGKGRSISNVNNRVCAGPIQELSLDTDGSG